MKIKIYMGYDGYPSVHDCKEGLNNNSCTSSVPYTSYYGFVPTFSDDCEFSFYNPLFYKGHAFQSGSRQESGQILGKDYSEILPDMGCKCSYTLFITTGCQKMAFCDF